MAGGGRELGFERGLVGSVKSVGENRVSGLRAEGRGQ